jgi:hypothetical protein
MQRASVVGRTLQLLQTRFNLNVYRLFSRVEILQQWLMPAKSVESNTRRSGCRGRGLIKCSFLKSLETFG